MYIRLLNDESFPGKEELIALMEKEPGVSPILIAAKAELWDSIPHLLAIAQIKATINEQNESEETAIHIAVFFQKADVIELLRNNGAATTDQELANWRDKRGYSLLMLAVADRSIDRVRFLLNIPEVKETINSCSMPDGVHTALAFAVSDIVSLDKNDHAKRAELVKVLLASGAWASGISIVERQETDLTTVINAAKDLESMAYNSAGRYYHENFKSYLNAGASVNQQIQAAEEYIFVNQQIQPVVEYVSLFEAALRNGNTEMILANFLDPIQLDLNEVDKIQLEIEKTKDEEVKRVLEKSKEESCQNAVKKTKMFLAWLNRRDLSKRPYIAGLEIFTKSEIYFKFAELIASNVVLVGHEDFGYIVVDNLFKKVEKNTPFYQDAQHKLLELYLVQEGESVEEREALLVEAFVHSSAAGDDVDSVNLRKRLMKTALNTDLDIPGDPKDPSDLFKIFLMLGKRLFKAAEKNNNAQPDDALLFAYKNTPMLEDKNDKKRTLSPSNTPM